MQVFGVSGKRFARGSVNQAGLCSWECHLSFIFFVSKQSANGIYIGGFAPGGLEFVGKSLMKGIGRAPNYQTPQTNLPLPT